MAWEAQKVWAVGVILTLAGNMKKIGIIGLFILLLISCKSNEDEILNTWEVAVGRATTNGENIIVVGKKNGFAHYHQS